MKKISMLLLLLMTVWSFQACNSGGKKEDSMENAEEANEAKADNNTTPVKEDDDAEFAVKAASGGMLEVQLGKMAQEKASSPRVKSFARMMVDDHTKANDELKRLASSKNITLPATLGEEHQKHVDDLSKLSGAEFDKQYVKLMVDDHQEDVDEFTKAAENAKDADLKAFASKTRPVLQKHLDEIKAIDKSMQ